MAVREWDDDNSGAVSRDEFAKALPMLGLEASVEQINAIFDEWDPDKSGKLEIGELNSLLRRRVELDPSLMPGAAGEIELGIDQRYAVRKGKLNKDDSVLLQGLDLQENGKPIAEQVTCAVGVVRCGVCARGLCLLVVCGVGCIGAGHGGVCVRDPRGGGGVCRRSPMPLRRTWCA